MMEFKLPELGENVHSGTLVRVMVVAGKPVAKDQAVVEIETDKAAVEVPSTVAGMVMDVKVKAGDKVSPGQVLFTVEGAAEPAQAVPVKSAAAPAKPAASRPSLQPPPINENDGEGMAGDTPASPSVRRFAREIGVDLARVRPSVEGGRITIEDVQSYARRRQESASAPGATTAPALPDFSKWGPVERQAMSAVRRATAEHLALAWANIPQVTQHDKADITEFETLRKERSTADVKITVTALALKIAAAALQRFPQFNSSLSPSTGEIILKKYCHVGVAVDTDRGLLVPVIRDVEKKTIGELSRELGDAAQKARNKKLGLDDMRGGTFTITNLGGIGGTSFSPIVNWPEVAILGLSRGAMEPVWINGAFAPRLRMTLSLSYDHRVIDGADGARFLRFICEAMEKPLAAFEAAA